MEKKHLLADDAPAILVETVGGEFTLKGHDEQEIIAKTDTPEALTLEVTDKQVLIRCLSELTLHVPRRAKIKVATVQGSATLKGLGGSLEIGAVAENLILKGVANVRLSKVSGNLVAKNIAGHLSIGQIDGNAILSDVQGEISVGEAVNGNLDLSDVDNNVHVVARGNVALRLDPAPGQNYTIQAGGDIFCRLAEDASVIVDILQARGKIMINWPELETPAPQAAPASLTLGEGDANLCLLAGRNVVLDRYIPDWSALEYFDLNFEEMNGLADTISEQIQRQLNAQMEVIEAQINAQINSLSARLSATSLSEEQARRVEERVRQAGERTAARAQERIRRAQERLEERLATAQRKAALKARSAERLSRSAERSDRRTRAWSFHFPSPPPLPAEPVGDEERLMILRMLEQKKISLEQAEQLLAALEGKNE